MSEMTAMTAMTAMTTMTAMTAMTGRSPHSGLAALTAHYGDPLLTEGLLRSSEQTSPRGLADAYAPARNGDYAPNALPLMEDPKHLAWWQPEVRGHLASLELHEGISFRAAYSDEDRPRRVGLQMNYASSDDSNGRSPLVRVDRPGPQALLVQLEKVRAHGATGTRRDRAPEVITQVLPQVPYWSSVAPLSPWRTPHTFEFIGAALAFGNQVCHRFKHSLAVPRPAEISPLVQPILQTPGWSALPSGHATEAFMFAKLMLLLLEQHDTGSALSVSLYSQAKRISDNRVYAGLHFPMDSVAGRLLGVTLAEYAAARAGVSVGQADARHFDGQTNEAQDCDLDLGVSLDRGQPYFKVLGQQSQPSVSPILAEMWKRARIELSGLGFGAAPQPE